MHITQTECNVWRLCSCFISLDRRTTSNRPVLAYLRWCNHTILDINLIPYVRQLLYVYRYYYEIYRRSKIWIDIFCPTLNQCPIFIMFMRAWYLIDYGGRKISIVLIILICFCKPWASDFDFSESKKFSIWSWDNIRHPKKFETRYILLQSYFLCRLQYNARHTKVFKIHLRTLCFNQKEGLSQIVMYIKNLIYINVPFH